MINIPVLCSFLFFVIQYSSCSPVHASSTEAVTRAVASISSLDERYNDHEEFWRLREIWFEITPHEAGIAASPQFPNVFSVIMDWRIHDKQVLVGVASDGTSSLCISPGPRILGGYSAKDQALLVITAAELIYQDAEQVSTHPLPPPDEVSFYIRTYDGLFVQRDKQSDLLNGRGKALQLFIALNKVMSIHLDTIDSEQSPRTSLTP